MEAIKRLGRLHANQLYHEAQIAAKWHHAALERRRAALNVEPGNDNDRKVKMLGLTFSKQQARDAQKLGRQWALSRFATGSTWMVFYASDVATENRDLAILTAKAASRAFRRLIASKPQP